MYAARYLARYLDWFEPWQWSGSVREVKMWPPGSMGASLAFPGSFPGKAPGAILWVQYIGIERDLRSTHAGLNW